MSIVSKLIIVIIIFVFIIIGIWLVFRPATIKKPIVNIPQNQNTQGNNNIVIKISPEDASDSALNSDLTIINNEIKSLSDDFAGIDAFLAQAPVVVDNTDISISTIINQADEEIDQKIKNLNDLLTRVNLMKKITIAQQDDINILINNEIDLLNVSKAKIDSNTSTPTAIADYQSLVGSYKICDLVIFEVKIITASDRVLVIVGYMGTVGKKIQTRISNLTGINLSSMQKLLSNFTLNNTAIGTQARAAFSEAFVIQPNILNQQKYAANMAALNDSRLKLKNTNDSLNSSRDNLVNMIRYLQETGGYTNVTK